MCARLHFHIWKETEVKLDVKHWYEQVPNSVEIIREGKVTILWNQEGQTKTNIPNYKQGNIIRDN